MAVVLRKGDSRILSVTKARQVLFSLLENIEYEGKSVARVVNPDEWKGLMATLEILAEPKHQAKLDRAIKEVEDGKTYSFEEVFGHKQPNL